MSVNDQLDITSSEMLEKLLPELYKQGIEVMLADVHKPVLEMARRIGLTEHLREELIFPTVEVAVQYYLMK